MLLAKNAVQKSCNTSLTIAYVSRYPVTSSRRQ